MNILWLMANQMRGDCAGFMGHPIVRTPNLDRLASRSVVFENVFVQSPLCGPSRTCLFSSRYAHEHGVWWNGVPVTSDHDLLPEMLRRAGYRTAIIGKLHFAPPNRAYGFDHKELHEELLLDGTDLDAYVRFLNRQNPPAKTAYESTEATNRRSEVGICRIEEALEETRWAADRTCVFLKDHAKSPFFLFASFIRPHSPYNPLARFARLYADVKVPPPPFRREEWDRVPPRVHATAESWGWDKLTDNDFGEIRRHYYGLCSQVDENVGRILDALEQCGLADSTLVIFTSDHGDFLGEPGELYHLMDDPDERNNVFGDTSCRTIKDELQAMLLDWLTETENLPAPDPRNPYFSNLFV